MAKNANRKPGGGYGSAVNREVGQRLGRGAQEQRPRGVSQIGESIGNKSTEMGKVKGVPSEKIQGARLPPGLSVELGNSRALNVGSGGPGAGESSTANLDQISSTAPPSLDFPVFAIRLANGLTLTPNRAEAQKEKTEMTEVKLTGKPLAERLNDRLKNSGAGANPDLTTKHGDSAQRVFHNLHHSGSVGGTKLNPGEDKGGR